METKYLLTTTKNEKIIVKPFFGETWGATLHSARTHWEGQRYIKISEYNVEMDLGVVKSVQLVGGIIK